MVTSTADAGAGSLRDALDVANGNGEDDVITFSGAAAGATITLSTGGLGISEVGFGLDIQGSGETINANGTGRVFNVNDGDDLTLNAVSMSNLTVTGGYIQDYTGAGIQNAEDLTLTNVSITGNVAGQDLVLATLAAAGGISNFGTLTMNDSFITGNSSLTVGGGMLNTQYATATLTNVDVDGNTADASYTGYSAFGGGISNDGVLTLSNSNVTNNEARNFDAINLYGILGAVGGGIENSATGTLTISGGSVSDNFAEQGQGGGIQNVGTANISGATLDNNFADLQGGGIANDSAGNMTMVDSNMSGNITNGTPSGLPYTTQGGAIFNDDASTLSISGGMFQLNKAYSPDVYAAGFLDGVGGAIQNDDGSQLTIDGAVFYKNGYYPTAVLGGAISNDDGAATVTITNSVFDQNEGFIGGAVAGEAGSISSVEGSTFTGNLAIVGSATGTRGLFIAASGDLTISKSNFSGNVGAGTVWTLGNAAVAAAGGVNLTVTQSSITGNTSTSTGAGIDINNEVTAVIENSTIANNSAYETGGGLYVNQGSAYGPGSVTLTGSTVTGNSIDPLSLFGRGGGIHIVEGDVVLNGSIVAGNVGNPTVGGPDIDFIDDGAGTIGVATLTTSIVGDNTSSGLAVENGPNYVGDATTPVDPMLMVSMDGSYYTPQAGSVAIDNAPGLALAVDQLGNSRPAGSAPDIGSIEVGATGFLPTDFNMDGLLNCDDINAQQAEIFAVKDDPSQGNPLYDLNNDGLVNIADRNQWLVDAGIANGQLSPGYLLGDINFDGAVDVSDFNIWNQNRFSSTTEWCVGDLNADGAVDVSDFNIWNNNRFMSTNPPVVAGEPGAARIAAAGELGTGGARAALRNGAQRDAKDMTLLTMDSRDTTAQVSGKRGFALQSPVAAATTRSTELFVMSDTGSQFGSSVATVNVAVQKAQSSFTLQMNQADERKDAADSRLRTAQAAVDSVFAEL